MWATLTQWLIVHPGEVAAVVSATLTALRAGLEYLSEKRRKSRHEPVSERRTMADALLERIVRLQVENKQLRAELKRARRNVE